MIAQPSFQPDPLSLDGLDDLLERPQLQIVEPAQEQEIEEVSETALILDLLHKLTAVNEQLTETSTRLTAASNRVVNLAAVVAQQNRELSLMSTYQEQASRIPSLEEQLYAATREIERLSRPWWQKLFDQLRKLG